jgi:hypothetical protein
MVIVVPATAVDGVKEVIVGTPVVVVKLKEVLLVAVPLGVVTVNGPVVAPVGTTTDSRLLVADVTLATAPLIVTVSCCAFSLNDVPEIVTAVPTGPLLGVKSRTDT